MSRAPGPPPHRHPSHAQPLTLRTRGARGAQHKLTARPVPGRTHRTAQNIRLGTAQLTSVTSEITIQIGGYACASSASGGSGASRAPRIAGGVTASLPLPAACRWALGRARKGAALICSGAASRRGLPYGGSTRFYGGSTRWQGHLSRFAGLRLRCGDCRAAAGGCRCASLMIKRRAAATAVRPGVRPDPGSPPSSFPQVTPGPVGAAGAAASFRLRNAARPALAVLAWSGDGSPVWGCTTTSRDQVPPRTPFRIKALNWPS